MLSRRPDLTDRRRLSLELTERQAQTGSMEGRVTYPGFYPLRNGDLVFLYRDGASGDGDVLINRYDVRGDRWHAVQHPLIDGEGARNAYFNQLAIDASGFGRPDPVAAGLARDTGLYVAPPARIRRGVFVAFLFHRRTHRLASAPVQR